MLRRSATAQGWHYVHPKTGKPLRQTRRFADPRYINNEAALIQGQWGLITADFGLITMTQMENARLAILRRIPRSQFTLNMHTDYMESPIVKKNPEARFGGGKSNISVFAFKFTTGIPLFELAPIGNARITEAHANGIFLTARKFLPIETTVVPQGRVDEYTVFK
jgi:ribosomal protein L16/L10AE